jgi:hypothetical protein
MNWDNQKWLSSLSRREVNLQLQLCSLLAEFRETILWWAVQLHFWCSGKYRNWWVVPQSSNFCASWWQVFHATMLVLWWNRELHLLSFQTIATSNLLQALAPSPHLQVTLCLAGILVTSSILIWPDLHIRISTSGFGLISGFKLLLDIVVDRCGQIPGLLGSLRT